MKLIYTAIGLISLLPITASFANENTVNIYSFRQAELLSPLITEFTQQTGINVNVVSGKADKLFQRLIDDGDDSFADVLLTVDAVRLERAKSLNIIQPINSTFLINNIPSNLRDPENYWFGMSIRARSIFYNKKYVNPQQIKSYQSLLDKQWKGQICSRKGSHMYNVSMVASFIHQHGWAWADNWVKKFTSNLAMRPNGGDRDQIRKVARGECTVAIANSYYYGMLSASSKKSDRDAYQQVGIIFPKDGQTGTHVNISGAALTHSSKNKLNAIKFIEFLATKKAQKIYANNNYEFPINPDVKLSFLLESWGNLHADTESIHQLYKNFKQANGVIKKNHW